MSSSASVPDHLTMKPARAMADIAKAYRAAIGHRGHGPITLRAAGSRSGIPLPPAVARMLGTVLTALADGREVSITTTGEELTTTVAAKRLGVSRPFLIAQIDAGRLPCRMVGSHRRIRAADLAAFRAAMERSTRALQGLADQAQELGMGY